MHRDRFRIGQQLFTFSLERDALLDRGHTAPASGAVPGGDLEPGPCRPACLARIKGPVEVEIL